MYRVNEIFYTLQGEGAHNGIPAVFVRFSGCNLRCPWCDTDFTDSNEMTAEQIVAEVVELYDIPNERHKMCVLTGGEPSLQVDKTLIDALHEAGFYIGIETNGTRPLPEGIDWITCSPKEGTKLALRKANEVKVVFTGTYDPVNRFVSREIGSSRTSIPVKMTATIISMTPFGTSFRILSGG